MQKPSAILPVQCMGILVGLFGAGYLRVSWRPVPNRDLLLLGMLSKALCGTLALYYTARGVFPWWFALVVFAVDLVYVPLFWLIWRRLCRLDEPTEDAWSAFKTPGNEGASNSGDGDDGGERRKEDKGIDARK